MSKNRYRYLLSVFFLILGAYVLFYFLRGSESSTPSERKFQGRTMDQWLEILATNDNSAGDLLKIIRVIEDKKSDTDYVEVPLSYDLLERNGFFEENGKFDLVLNERGYLPLLARATNGNCLLGFDENNLNFGTNQIRVEFFIFNPSNLDRPLHAESSPTQFVSSRAVYIRPQIFAGRDNQMVLWADLSISNADYSIELLDTNGNCVKTIIGHTLDGAISEQWNLIGDSGKTYPRDAFGVIYHVAVSNSSGVVTQDYKISAP